MKKLRNFFKSETAATSVEYCMLVSFIAVAIILAVSELGATLSTKFVRTRQGIN